MKNKILIATTLLVTVSCSDNTKELEQRITEVENELNEVLIHNQNKNVLDSIQTQNIIDLWGR